ncbi:melatonin receptor type 1B-B-like [Exaiptasia diaphana]|uniref:G-protein coupled receptors family 1 profile domain-containing protein n=1 Tax=Exaiptasia diaphana TaxID=2652724 RepID=A0A913X6Y5_EXADI|nr:melatonin receptor type 1B-B-like [Exaiptasia diaphana]XP_020899931.1 melatonin receptor type 1B-B-like [Exaiptasia diaphana]
MGQYTPEAIAETTFMIFICILASFGNISLFIVVFTNSNLKSISNYYVLSLAAADLMVVLVSGPVTASSMLKGKWEFGETACTLFGFITLLTFVASVNSLATIALNRYFFIVKWKEYKNIFNKRRSFLYGACTWGFSIFISILPLFGWGKFDYIPEKSYCFVLWPANVYYMYFMVIICFCGPLSAMLICYYKILTFTRNLKRKLFMSKTNPSSKKKFFKREARVVSPEETKLTNTLLIVVACFVFCWAPFAITMFFDVYHPHPIPREVHVGSLLLGYLNSMCNPILYGLRNTSFKKGFKNLYAKCLPCLIRKEEVSYFQSSIDGSENDSNKSKTTKDSYCFKNSFENVIENKEVPAEEQECHHPSIIFNHRVSPTFKDVGVFLSEKRVTTV